MSTLKRKVRYSFEWKVNDENGDCTARVTRSVFNIIMDGPIEQTKFQLHVSKYVFRIYPWPGQDVFTMPPANEYEKVVATAKAFYAGANKHEETFFWEIDDEDSISPVKTVEIIEPIVRKKKVHQKKKKKAGEIWQTTT
jgi:hypothetical protein